MLMLATEPKLQQICVIYNLTTPLSVVTPIICTTNYHFMKNSIFLTVILFSFLSCSGPSKSPEPSKQAKSGEPSKTGEPDKKVALDLMNFDETLLLRNSEYVVFPLKLKKDDESGSFISKRSASSAYWNIVFYNSATKDHYLLDDKRKMVILAYSNPNIVSQDADNDTNISNGRQQDSLIYYSVLVTDLNHDGKLDGNDPTYLFKSDNTGKNFKQISPENLDVVGWHIISKTNKLLIETRNDTNSDKKFDSEDITTPYLYDLKTGKIEQAFSEGFSKDIKALFKKQWPAEK